MYEVGRQNATTAGTSAAPTTGGARQTSRQGLAGAGYEQARLQLKPQENGTLSAREGVITVAGTGETKTYIPARSNGKTLYFFYGLKSDAKDRGYRDTMDNYVEDDIASAVQQGFTVVYDRAGTKAAFLAACYNSNTFGIYWCGHGYMDGTIQTNDGGRIAPEDIDKSQVSPNIQYLILAACGTGVGEKRWKKVMGPQCRFQGWVNTVSLAKVNDFTTDSWFDGMSGHEGTNPDMELDDYISAAAGARRAE